MINILNKLKYIFCVHMILLLPTVFVSGCVPTGVVPKSFQFDQGSNIGIAAFSVRCLDYRQSPAYLGSINYNGGYYWLALNSPQVYFTCNGVKQIELLNLKGGKYQFALLKLMGFGEVFYPKEMSNIDFSVIPGKVNYIGNILVTATEDTIEVKIVNDWLNDNPLIMQKLPSIPADKYEYQTMKLSNK